MLPWEIMTSVTASRLKLPGFSAGLQAYLLGHEDAFPSPHDERPRQYTITTASIPFHTKYKAARQHFELCLPPVGYCRKSRPHNLNSASQQQSCLLRVCAPPTWAPSGWPALAPGTRGLRPTAHRGTRASRGRRGARRRRGIPEVVPRRRQTWKARTRWERSVQRQPACSARENASAIGPLPSSAALCPSRHSRWLAAGKQT